MNALTPLSKSTCLTPRILAANKLKSAGALLVFTVLLFKAMVRSFTRDRPSKRTHAGRRTKLVQVQPLENSRAFGIGRRKLKLALILSSFFCTAKLLGNDTSTASTTTTSGHTELSITGVGNAKHGTVAWDAAQQTTLFALSNLWMVRGKLMIR